MKKISSQSIFLIVLAVICILLSAFIKQSPHTEILLSAGFLLFGWGGMRKPGDIPGDSVRPPRNRDTSISDTGKTPVEFPRKKREEDK